MMKGDLEAVVGLVEKFLDHTTDGNDLWFARELLLKIGYLNADAPEHIVPKRVRVAAEAGCGGLVCAAADLKDAREFAPRLKRVVPGIRPDGAPVDDQRRAATPQEALDAGADLLVIGRPITRAAEPAEAAASLASSLS